MQLNFTVISLWFLRDPASSAPPAPPCGTHTRQSQILIWPWSMPLSTRESRSSSQLYTSESRRSTQGSSWVFKRKIVLSVTVCSSHFSTQILWRICFSRALHSAYRINNPELWYHVKSSTGKTWNDKPTQEELTSADHQELSQAKRHTCFTLISNIK